MLCIAVAAVIGLGVGSTAQASSSHAVNAAMASGAAPTARDLPLTPSVDASLVAAAAASHGLPSSAFLGVAPASQGFAAYYGYDAANSTYWAAASLVPNPKSYEAGVVVQDDGAYLIFHRTKNGRWQVQDAGYTDSVGDCAAYHVNLPAAIVAVWHWITGTCHPPAVPAATTTTTKAAPLTGVALARYDWFAGARSTAAQEGEFWVRAATALTSAAADTQADRLSAARLRQLAGLPDAQESPAQQAESGADAAALNRFFASNGLYGINAPSATTSAFVATLQAEARIGTLSANEPQADGATPGRSRERRWSARCSRRSPSPRCSGARSPTLPQAPSSSWGPSRPLTAPPTSRACSASRYPSARISVRRYGRS